VAPLDLRQRLRVEIEVVKVEASLTGDERAQAGPVGPHRNELVRRGQLDVELERFLERRNGAQYRILIGHQLDVDVDGRFTPA
jgi:hypothetical protein